MNDKPLKKRYLILTSSLGGGGAERVVSLLAGALVGTGRDVTVMVQYRTESPYSVPPEVKILNMSGLDAAAYRTGRSICRSLRFRREFIRIVKEEDPDIILAFLAGAVVKADLFLRGTKYHDRVFNTLRNIPEKNSDNRLMNRLFLRSIIKGGRLIVQCRDQYVRYLSTARGRQRKGQRVWLLPNPVSPELAEIAGRRFGEESKGRSPAVTGNGQEAEPQSEVIVAAAGRLVPHKNFSYLLEAFAEAAGRTKADGGPALRLKIFGEGPEKEALAEKIRELGIEDRAELAGRSASFFEMYGEAHIFAMTSLHEGMPNVLLEAMAAGLAAVAADCPTGPAELIRDGENGFLVKMNDRETLIGRLVRMAMDAGLRERLGKAASASVRDAHSCDVICSRLIAICEGEAEPLG